MLATTPQRNVAQCFHEGDLSAAAALSYAVNVLQVEAIIVCGERSPFFLQYSNVLIEYDHD